MARKKKVDLIEEARGLGLVVDENEYYDDIADRIKKEREWLESGAGVPEEDEDEWDPFLDVSPLDEPAPEPRTRGWSKLGVWVGGGRPS